VYNQSIELTMKDRKGPSLPAAYIPMR